MSQELDGLPDYLIAALKAPEGTSVDDVLVQFPHAGEDQQPREHPEFAARYDDARFEWQRINGWGPIPKAIAQRLADQVRSDIAWEQDS